MTSTLQSVKLRLSTRTAASQGLCNIAAQPYVGQHVADAFAHFCSVIDGLLSEEFGGRTVFKEVIPSTMKD
jgi:hypothetical protein